MNFKKLASLLVLLAGLAGLSFGQTALTQTTLSGAVNGPALYSGTTPTISGQVTLASCTGIAAPILPGTPSSIIYVGTEAMGVFSVNSTSCVLTVNRGYLGTQAAPHPSGDMVLYGPNYAATIAQGGNILPSGLFQQDPARGSACTASNTPTTPWVNVLTGSQWLCSSLTNSWVPGFGNPLVPVLSEVTASVASVAGATLPSGPLFHVTGTNAITSWTVPVGCNATATGGCQFTIIPDAICTWTSAGNIALGGSCVVNKALTFLWDAKNSKWIPSYIA
jgi:hypothetical protein